MKKETRGKPEDTVSEELRKSVSENARVSIPVYERAKGRQMQGSKTWKVSEKESKTVSVLAVVFTVMVVLALVSFFLPISGWAKALLFFLAIFSGIGVMGGYMAFIVFAIMKKIPWKCIILMWILNRITLPARGMTIPGKSARRSFSVPSGRRIHKEAQSQLYTFSGETSLLP